MYCVPFTQAWLWWRMYGIEICSSLTIRCVIKVVFIMTLDYIKWCIPWVYFAPSFTIVYYLDVHSSFVFHGFFPRGFVNLRSRSKNKNTSLRPIYRQEHQNFSITRRSLRAILCDDQGVECGGGRKKPLPSLQKKSLEILIKHRRSGGVVNYLWIFAFSGRSLNLNPAKSGG